MSKSPEKSWLVQGYEVVIGFETHTQLTTQSKLFSRAATSFGAEPNTQASSVDFALPGALPVMNKGAVQRAIEFGLAVNGHIAESSIFARKNYFYPDLPKGYQISQYETPVVQGGAVEFFLDGEKKSVKLVRAHLEEDAGKSIHGDGLYSVAGQARAGFAIVGFGPEDSAFDLASMSGIDLNRAGTPLLEIVTEPDMRSSNEAVAYAKELHKIVTWIGICDGNMQEGSFRSDANVSVRKPGAALGTRREIKNLNSFKFMQQAIDYEVRWQISELEEGRAIQQATVLFDPDTGETRSMRTKEDAADYRYFPDPDLPPLVISREWVEQVKLALPELPRKLAETFVEKHGLSGYDAAQLTQTPEFARYFQTLVVSTGEAKVSANWMLGELASYLNRTGLTLDDIEIPNPVYMAAAITRVLDGTVNANAGKRIFHEFLVGLRKTQSELTKLAQAIEEVDAFIQQQDLRQLNDSAALEKIIDDVLAVNAKNVAEYKAGNTKAFNALVGQAMKASQGKANPAQVNELLKKKLG